MTPASQGLSAKTRTLLAHALDRDGLDAADLRLIELITTRMGERNSGANAHANLDALALIVATLCRTCAEGNLSLPWKKEELAAGVRDVLSASGVGDARAGTRDEGAALLRADIDPEKVAADFLTDAETGRLITILGTPESPRPLIQANGHLYFHRHWYAERTVAEALHARAASDATGMDVETLRRVLQDTLSVHPLRSRDPTQPSLSLAARQKLALVAALRERVFVLSGGPGTGKTTWTASWLRALLRLPGATADRVRLCAPTGRAAQRLQESLRASLGGVTEGVDSEHPDARALTVPVTTLHALLGYQPHTGRFARSHEDPLDADWVLVDEASMVDVFLLATLVRALPTTARLILVGDADQLPPVDAASVLGDLIPHDRAPRLSHETREAAGTLFPELAAEFSEARAESSSIVPSVVLDVSHRAKGAVVPLAAAVLAGNATRVLEALGDLGNDARPIVEAFRSDVAVARIAPSDSGNIAHDLAKTLQAWADAIYGRRTGAPLRTYAEWLEAFRRTTRENEPAVLEALWRVASSARALAPLRRGVVSTESANRILRAHLEPKWSQRGDRVGQGFHGAPILITRNDRATGLANGEIGLWLETGEGATLFFPRPEQPDGWLRLPVSLLPAHEPGFAVTVHKSQGSEYDEVLILLPEAGNRLLARETLYTAITRARTAVRVYGSAEAIGEAVGRTLRRPGGLRQALDTRLP